ncbi:unnamed protein product, partial [Larinioides sclopetarius]
MQSGFCSNNIFFRSCLPPTFKPHLEENAEWIATHLPRSFSDAIQVELGNHAQIEMDKQSFILEIESCFRNQAMARSVPFYVLICTSNVKYISMNFLY